MKRAVLRDPPLKKLLRGTWSLALGIHALCNLETPRERAIRVFYGGARPGDVGGPLIKVKHLRKAFPEHWRGYNLVYLLSNAPYLPGLALRTLKRRGVPIVHNQNGVFYPAWFAGDWQAQNRRMARSYHVADLVLYQSEFCRRAAELYLGPRQGAGEILYNAVDTTHFTPRPAAEEAPDGSRPFTLLVTGKIGTHLFYRLESAIRGLAVARREGLEGCLTIAGWVEPAAQRQALDLAERLGVQKVVAFTGPYTQEAAPAVYRAADAYVATKHNDPCPNTVLEAMACGLPVVYSDTGGVPELVGEEAGVELACAEDWDKPQVPSAEEVGAGMVEVASRRAAFAAAARKRAVERFDIRHWIDRHREVFTRLIVNPW